MNSAVVAALMHCSFCFMVGHSSISGMSSTVSGNDTVSCWTLSTSTHADRASKSTEVTVTQAMQGNLTSETFIGYFVLQFFMNISPID